MGKTIHIIALILRNRPRGCGPTLVVCPAGVCLQWEQEISSKTTKKAKLKVLVYKNMKRADSKWVQGHDVVIVSYNTLTIEAAIAPARSRKGKQREGSMKKTKEPGTLHKIPWFRVVLDECHTVKNRHSQAFKAVRKLEADRRWCLSGTPIQNKDTDLFPYFNFLRYKPYSAWNEFKQLSKMVRREREKGQGQGMVWLNKEMVVVTLRRDKSE